MSDYCAGCGYDPAVKSGPKACPFNYLYWNFLIENEGKLARNPRMAMPYRTLAKMTPARREEITRESQAFLDSPGLSARQRSTFTPSRSFSTKSCCVFCTM